LDPRRLNPTLDVAFVETLADMMAKDPADRIASAAEVIQRLAPWTDSPQPISPTAGASRRRRGVAWSCTSPPMGPSDGTIPDETQLKDTSPDFPEFSWASPRVRANDWAGVGRSGLSEALPEAAEPELSPLSLADCLRPLLVLVGIPLIFLGLLSLVVWLLVK
jgi:hypothetical protein